MNTKISVAKSFSENDHLLILTDDNNFEWSKGLLSKAELAFIKKAAKDEVPYLFLPQAKRHLIVQILEKSDTLHESKEDARMAGSEILTLLSHYKIEKITVLNKQKKEDFLLEYIEGMALGNYQFLKYFKNKKEKANCLKTIRVDAKQINTKALSSLKAVVSATSIARDLVNEPLSYLTAEKLSEEIVNASKTSGFKTTVFKKKKIQSLKMGGILAVNRGSAQPPTFNILEWKPKNAKNKKPIVLVGKGVVYDTGGLSLKPTANSMDKMKCDMAGAATVIGAMVALSKDKLPLHVIGLIPATDNRPGKEAYVPGDVITMYSGSTVEVMNTDAEGRLILADALHYAKKYKPELVMDFATLTGSAARAVGPEAICFMGNAQNGIKGKMKKSGESVYERLVEFPLWREYGEYLKSNIADLKNLGGSSAGMITAGKFLEHFTDYPWIHFDIAGTAFLNQANGYRPKDGTGVGVRLLFDFLKNYNS